MTGSHIISQVKVESGNRISSSNIWTQEPAVRVKKQHVSNSISNLSHVQNGGDAHLMVGVNDKQG